MSFENWQNFYGWHDPVIFSIGGFALRWYGLMFVTALTIGYLWGRRMVKRGDWQPMKATDYEALFLYFIVGIILGTRLGYVFFYGDTLYMLSHPWQIFNPFQNGEFVGISGLSYHGGVVGVIAALFIFAARRGFSIWRLLDLAAVAGSAGYMFGRVGNFLNAELPGRVTDVAWGVRVNGVLRHPSALYEAFLEGLLLFAVMTFLYKRRKFDGQMAFTYAMLYAAARFTAELWRQPDEQLGFIAFGWLTMGQLLSALMFTASLVFYLKCRSRKQPTVA
ncbi:MAG: prolipoprotein diacylglyceryl transferase [Helicobacteraceae bacterium]|jgi:phosphatidylglycerol:prolipoprotein diacylglycerol transferase|nr:prolipoprotein diacylglyceryl transferase [Helicobacteraceae bacterium]